MKTRMTRGGSFLRSLMFLALIFTALQVAPRSAHACGWTDPWNCAADSAKWAWAGLVDGYHASARFAIRVWGASGTITCDVKFLGTGGHEMRCFGDRPSYQNRLVAALDFIDADSRSDFTKGPTSNLQNYSPKGFVNDRIAYLLDGASSEVQDIVRLGVNPPAGQLAVTECNGSGGAAPVIIWPDAFRYYHDDATGEDDYIGLAATLVHESDHTRICDHTCGDGDHNENGPYGTEIQWLGKVYQTGNPGSSLSALDRNLTWLHAVNRLTHKICDADARARLWNKFLVNVPTLTDFSGLIQSSTSHWVTLTPTQVTKVAITNIDDGEPLIYGLGIDGAVYWSSPGGVWHGPTGSWDSRGAVPFVDIATSVNGDSGVFAVGNDGLVYNMQNGGMWTMTVHADSPTDNQVAMSQIAIASNEGWIYGLASYDHAVYRATIDGQWNAWAPPSVSNISVTPDGTVYGVGTDLAVYVAPNLGSSAGAWSRVSDGSVTQIFTPPGGFIYGLGLDHSVYLIRSRPTNKAEAATNPGWTPVTDGEVSHIWVSTDGYIFGVDNNGAIEVHGSYRN